MKTLLICVGAICFVAVVIIGGFSALFICGFAPTKVISDSPQTYKEAKKHIPIHLPETATAIQYASYGEWQIYEGFIKFQAPVNDCIANARFVIEENQKRLPQRKSDLDQEFRPIVKSFSPTSNYLGTLPWFDVDKISKGIAIGADGDSQPHIWIDTEKGIFYYHIWH